MSSITIVGFINVTVLFQSVANKNTAWPIVHLLVVGTEATEAHFFSTGIKLGSQICSWFPQESIPVCPTQFLWK